MRFICCVVACLLFPLTIWGNSPSGRDAGSADRGLKDTTAEKGKSDTWNVIRQILIGNTYRQDKVSFHFNGLLRSVPEYNFVDGFWIGQQVRLVYRPNEKLTFALNPSVYYGTARKAFNWYVNTRMSYDPMRNGELIVSLGDRSEDYNGPDGMLPFINTVSSLVFGHNPIRYYRKRYISVSNEIDLMDGVRVVTGFLAEKRTQLRNHTGFNFFNRTPDPNVLPDIFAPMPPNTALKTNVELIVTPYEHYEISNGRKVDRHSLWPTFHLEWEQAIPNDADAYPSFARFALGINQEIALNIKNRLEYYVQGGIFAGSGNRYYPDYKHFLTRQFFISEKLPERSFCVSGYRHAAGERWGQLHISWNSRKFLLTRLPFMRRYRFEEGLIGRALWIPQILYSEFGYSIGIRNSIKIGLFCGLENGRYDSMGFMLSIPLLQRINY